MGMMVKFYGYNSIFIAVLCNIISYIPDYYLIFLYNHFNLYINGYK